MHYVYASFTEKEQLVIIGNILLLWKAIYIICFSTNKEEIVMQTCEPYGLHSYQEREGDYEDSPNIYEEADYCKPN